MHLEKMKDGGYTFHNFEKGDSIQRRDLIGDGWVARLTGLHPKYRYQRQFVEHPRDKDAWYDLHEGEIYEYRQLYCGESRYSYEKRGGISGFFAVRDGEIVDLEESEVRDTLKGSPLVSVPPDNAASATEQEVSA